MSETFKMEYPGWVWQRPGRLIALLSMPGGFAAFLGAAILLALILATALVPPFINGSPDKLSADLLQAPGAQHWMGTDNLGRDIFLQLIYGVRVSLFVGGISALAATVIGVLIGAHAGFSGGKVDLVLMRLTELFQVIPTFVLAAVIVAMWGAGLNRIVIVIALLSWPQIALIVRAEVIRLRKVDFVDAARCMGFSEFYIMIREVIPNALRPVLALTTLCVGQAIMMEASLSFLGLGDPNLFSWGKMVSIGQTYLRSAWWMSVFPGIAIFLTILACNLLGDGFNHLLNPRDKGR